MGFHCNMHSKHIKRTLSKHTIFALPRVLKQMVAEKNQITCMGKGLSVFVYPRCTATHSQEKRIACDTAVLVEGGQHLSVTGFLWLDFKTVDFKTVDHSFTTLFTKRDGEDRRNRVWTCWKTGRDMCTGRMGVERKVNKECYSNVKLLMFCDVPLDLFHSEE